jgi:hypothetical protein
MTKFRTDALIRVTCLVFACERADLTGTRTPIYRRRRFMACAAGTRLGIADATIGRPLGMSAREVHGAAKTIEDEAQGSKCIELIVKSIERGVREKRTA